MNGNVRLTRVGAALLLVLAAAIVAVIVGPQGVQAVAFIVIVIVALVLIADRLPRMRMFGGHDLGLQPRRSDRDRQAGPNDPGPGSRGA